MLTEVVTPHKLVTYEKIPTSIYQSSDNASKKVAGEIATLIKQQQQAGKFAVLGLATGSTLKKVYIELIRMHQTEGLSFKNVITFNLDEYYSLTPDATVLKGLYLQKNVY